MRNTESKPDVPDNSKEFQRRFPLLKIINPTDLLAEIETK